MRINLKQLLVFSLVASAPALTLQARQISKNGLPAAEIVIADNAGASEIYGANELQRWLALTSGATLPIVTRPTAGKTATKLIIGSTLARAFAKDLETLAGRDGYCIREKVDTNEIYIFGALPRGTLNGIFSFIEANTDLIWPRPDPAIGAVYSVNSNLAATVTDRIDIPRSTLRGWGWTVSSTRHEPDWASRNRINWLGYYRATNIVMGSMYNPAGGGHGLKLYMKPETHFDEHPEYFPFINGQRTKGGQLCFLAYEMIPTYLENLRADLDTKPECDGVNISITDGWGVCDCPKCLAPLKLADGTVIAPGDPAFRSTQFYLFLNKIAGEIRKTHPKVVILTYAYIFTVVPPPIKLEPNIRVMYCPFVKDDKFTIFEPERNAMWRRYTLGWGQATDKTWLREYYGCAADFPRPIEYTVQEDLRFCLTNGIHEFHSELPVDKPHAANPDRIWDASAMTMWVITRLWWNPDQDVNELRNVYLTRTFREAAKPMRDYFEMIRKSWYANTFPSVYSDDGNSMGKMYIVEAGLETPCREALEEAERLARHPVARELIRRQRVRFEAWAEFAKNDKTVRLTVPYHATAGELDFVAADWDKAGVATPFTVCEGALKGSNALFVTEARLLHDRKNLFIHLEARAPDATTLEGSMAKEDGSETFPRGDHFELFLANPQTGVYFHFAYDIGNVAVFDAKGYDAKWSSTWSRKIARRDDRWESIVTIPLADIGCNITEGNKLRFLPYRSKYFRDSTLDKQGKAVNKREQSSWGGGFVHQVAAFGEITLEQK